MNGKINFLTASLVIIGLIVMASCTEILKDESISTKNVSEVIKDIDGNTYKTVTIGEQTWLAENLKVTHFRNGDPILHVTGNYEWFEAGRDGIPAWRYYNDDHSTAEKYGKLYNGFAVSDPRGLAPEGWRIPGDADWENFFIAIGGKMSEPSTIKLYGDSEFAKNYNNRIISYSWSVYEQDLSDQFEWENDGIRNIFDASGFNLVAAGEVDIYGNFYSIDKSAKFWSYPTEKFSDPFPDGSGTEHASIRMGIIPKLVMHSRGSAPSGKSVRLVKE
ncbi:MAG: hypothetical protein EA393_00180 [Bacteroidetes bacterium]|nr:MAG: hypothetical protein EA393_00180 [Bacteroidota bacterium]